MATYTPPLRDMHFVLHEMLHVSDELKTLPAHAETDADTINAILEEGGKFASEVIFPLNQSGDREARQSDSRSHPTQRFQRSLQNLCGWRLGGAEL
jgi:hypothetical protein